MPETRKILVSPALAPKARALLGSSGYSFFDHEHAFWRAAKDGATVVFYKKGTLLFQGNDVAVKSAQGLLSGVMGISFSFVDKAAPGPCAQKTTLGLDESGKGDYFGPLVLAGAAVSPENSQKLSALGVMDSKKLSAGSIETLASEIEALVPFRVRIIMPEEYNRLYAGFGNLNLLMVDEYKKLIAGFDPNSYESVILDKFSASAAQNEEIRRSVSKEMTIVERAESNIPVAAASILARRYFVKTIGLIGVEFGLELPLGSGPHSGGLFTRLKSKMPRGEFEKIAKAHFKERG